MAFHDVQCDAVIKSVSLACCTVVQNETVLELAGRSRSMWVIQRIKSAVLGRGLDKSATVFQRTASNPVCFVTV